MLHWFRTKRSFWPTLVIPALLFLFLTLYSSSPLAQTVIDFESLPSTGAIVRDQFAKSHGIIFQPVLAVDYSQGAFAIPNFAHSGTKAIELCRGVELCSSPLDISFTSPQRRVKMWVGYAGRLDGEHLIILRAYDSNENEVGWDIRTLGPSAIVSPPSPFFTANPQVSTWPNNPVVPISTRIEFAAPSATIKRVKVGFHPDSRLFNIHNGLAFDDIEFDVRGPAPQCPATQPPVLTINEPTDGKIVIQNAITVDANLMTADPFATLQINATGAGGSRTFGPVFAASGHIRYFNLGGLLSQGENTLVFIASDCAGSTQVTRTVHFPGSVTRTSIKVIDENGANVQTARVYENGRFLGLTDAAGMLSVTPPLVAGTELVARKIVYESPTYRDNHSQGSFQNWKFRVYTSSMGVSNEGVLNIDWVNYHPDPHAPQVLRLMRRNALIGLHLIASIEWDASIAEMETVKQRLIETSRLLYNATDGQIFIEQAEIVDNREYWYDADYRIYSDQSLHPHVDWPGGRGRGAFFDNNAWSSSRIHVHRASVANTYAHEFGHYGFGLRDEYKPALGFDLDPGCTAIMNSSTGGDFGFGGPKASCMMDVHYNYQPPSRMPKLCSHRTENPHRRETQQGSSSCWSDLAGNFSDYLVPPFIPNPNPRWLIRTPDNRGGIPGLIYLGHLPLEDMQPRVTFQNISRRNLCQPITVLARHSDGTPHHNRDIWLKTTYGQNIFQGKTDEQGILQVTGAHVGDQIEGRFLGFPLDGRTVGSANCSFTANLSPQGNLVQRRPTVIPVAFSPTAGQTTERFEIGPPAFDIATVLKPTKEGAEVTVAVRDSARTPVALAKPPVVKFKVANMANIDARQIRLVYNSSTGSYSGTIGRLPVAGEVEIEVEATDRKHQVVESVSNFRMSGIAPGSDMEVISPDGHLTLDLPPNSLPSGTRIFMGSHPPPLPALPSGYEFVSGPFPIWTHPVNSLYRQVPISFQLPKDRKRSAFANYQKDSLRILHFDGQKWSDLGGVVRSDTVDIVTAKTARLGIFALVGRRIAREDQKVVWMFEQRHGALLE
jgi:hypothetical protein